MKSEHFWIAISIIVIIVGFIPGWIIGGWLFYNQYQKLKANKVYVEGDE